MPKILDGKVIRDELIIKLKTEIAGFKSAPTLAIVQIGDLEESNKYIKAKKSFGEKIGANVRHVQFSDTISQDEVIVQIQRLNQDETVQGIILQLPIPKNLNEGEITETIDPKKDVDGLTSKSTFIPATAKGVLTLLDYYKIDVAGKKVAMMGQSKLVGRPIARALLARRAPVTVVHSQTINPKEITRSADILIVAIGKPNLVDDTYVSPGQIVIDIGINMQNVGLLEEIPVEKVKLVGDVNFEKVKNIVSAITPVPGGVGPLTVASLFENLVEAYKNMI